MYQQLYQQIWGARRLPTLVEKTFRNRRHDGAQEHNCYRHDHGRDRISRLAALGPLQRAHYAPGAAPRWTGSSAWCLGVPEFLSSGGRNERPLSTQRRRLIALRNIGGSVGREPVKVRGWRECRAMPESRQI